jgi:hypothetical protein
LKWTVWPGARAAERWATIVDRRDFSRVIFLHLQSKIETELNAVGAVRLYGLTFVGTSFIQYELEK